MADSDALPRLMEEFGGLKRTAEALLGRERLSASERKELGRALRGMEESLRHMDYERFASPRKTASKDLQALRRELSAVKERARPLVPEELGASDAQAGLGQLQGLLGANRNVGEANAIAGDIGLQLERDMQRFQAGEATIKLLNTDLCLSTELIAAISAGRRQARLFFWAGLAAPLLSLLLYSLLQLVRLLGA